MRKIPWLEIIERVEGSTEDIKVVASYPFPDIDVNIMEFVYLPVSFLEEHLTEIDDELLRKTQLTRLHFILNVWHPKQFCRMTMGDWKYL